ncbi:MAG: DUF1285 domain-containing protein [Pseudomonadota bacterium]
MTAPTQIPNSGASDPAEQVASAPAFTTGEDALARLEKLLAETADRSRPPVHTWDPPAREDVGLSISYDGRWWYQDSPIERAELVRLFASVLRHDEADDTAQSDGGYFLVTPVEKVPITVAETPFVVVEMERRETSDGPEILLRTSVDDVVVLGDEHPVRFEPDGPDGGLKPIVHIRDRLEARVARAVYYELVDAATVETIDGDATFGLRSGGTFFAMARAADLPGVLDDAG